MSTWVWPIIKSRVLFKRAYLNFGMDLSVRPVDFQWRVWLNRECVLHLKGELMQIPRVEKYLSPLRGFECADRVPHSAGLGRYDRHNQNSCSHCEPDQALL
jgi:hypothetical protein